MNSHKNKKLVMHTRMKMKISLTPSSSHNKYLVNIVKFTLFFTLIFFHYILLLCSYKMLLVVGCYMFACTRCVAQSNDYFYYNTFPFLCNKRAKGRGRNRERGSERGQLFSLTLYTSYEISVITRIMHTH